MLRPVTCYRGSCWSLDSLPPQPACIPLCPPARMLRNKILVPEAVPLLSCGLGLYLPFRSALRCLRTPEIQSIIPFSLSSSCHLFFLWHPVSQQSIIPLPPLLTSFRNRTDNLLHYGRIICLNICFIPKTKKFLGDIRWASPTI